jgi:pentatricopeptide repeat domain-containing protein 1
MHQSGLVPNVVICDAAIGAFGKGEQWKHAQLFFFFFAVMQQSGLMPDVTICSAAISACGRGRQWQQALSPLVVMKQSGLVPGVIS